MNDAIRQLVIRHCETLKHEAEALDQTLVKGQLKTAAGRVAAFKAAHKLKGSSGTLGFHAVSEAARHLEMTLRALEGPVPEQCVTNDVAAAHASLATLIAQIRPEQSSLFLRCAG